jgi:hypothetical protein
MAGKSAECEFAPDVIAAKEQVICPTSRLSEIPVKSRMQKYSAFQNF